MNAKRLQMKQNRNGWSLFSRFFKKNALFYLNYLCNEVCPSKVLDEHMRPGEHEFTLSMFVPEEEDNNLRFQKAKNPRNRRTAAATRQARDEFVYRPKNPQQQRQQQYQPKANQPQKKRPDNRFEVLEQIHEEDRKAVREERKQLKKQYRRKE